mmetsp:Transcript_8220/g.25354  ORF Transcript_8220/g.25354 Transcript_8220/m.25354 type:complete len:337 (-) Transcript_8220:286-1296(-)
MARLHARPTPAEPAGAAPMRASEAFLRARQPRTYFWMVTVAASRTSSRLCTSSMTAFCARAMLASACVCAATASSLEATHACCWRFSSSYSGDSLPAMRSTRSAIISASSAGAMVPSRPLARRSSALCSGWLDGPASPLPASLTMARSADACSVHRHATISLRLSQLEPSASCKRTFPAEISRIMASSSSLSDSMPISMVRPPSSDLRQRTVRIEQPLRAPARPGSSAPNVARRFCVERMRFRRTSAASRAATLACSPSTVSSGGADSFEPASALARPRGCQKPQPSSFKMEPLSVMSVALSSGIVLSSISPRTSTKASPSSASRKLATMNICITL